MTDWIKFDINKVKHLKETYDGIIDYIAGDFEVNLNSPKQIKTMWMEELNVFLVDTKISTFQFIKNAHEADSPTWNLAEEMIVFLKAKYILKNYINCILEGEIDGIVTLRNTEGKLSMPNKQSLSYNQEIHQCIVAQSPEAARQTPDFMSKPQGE